LRRALEDNGSVGLGQAVVSHKNGVVARLAQRTGNVRR
jgi:hypothetical protein